MLSNDIHDAIKANDLTQLEALIVENAALDESKQVDWESFLLIPTKNHEITELLILMGADPLFRNDDETTPLHNALTGEVAQWLINVGADVNAVDEALCTSLHYAKSLDVINVLLKEGANVNAVDEMGETPIFCTEDIEIMKALINAGADLSHVRNDGDTLMHRVSTPEAVALLVNHMSVDVKDSEGKTALYYGLNYSYVPGLTPERDLKNNSALTKMLIKCGANLQIDTSYTHSNDNSLNLYYPAYLKALHFGLLDDIDLIKSFNVNFTSQEHVTLSEDNEPVTNCTFFHTLTKEGIRDFSGVVKLFEAALEQDVELLKIKNSQGVSVEQHLIEILPACHFSEIVSLYLEATTKDTQSDQGNHSSRRSGRRI